jgi:hypothetical protein
LSGGVGVDSGDPMAAGIYISTHNPQFPMLSYQTEPTTPSTIVGVASTGIIEVPVYGTLLPEEVKFIEEQELPDRRKPITVLADRITKAINAQHETVSTSREGNGFAPKAVKLLQVYYAVYAWIFGGITEAQIELIGDYLEDLNKLSDEVSALLENKSYIYALAILNGRLEQKLTIADLKNPKVLRPGLVDRIATLAYLEERGDIYDEATQYPTEKPQATEAKAEIVPEESEETLGKS